ncbi:11613_t:CDS:2, partial [Scutellospora calospora]
LIIEWLKTEHKFEPIFSKGHKEEDYKDVLTTVKKGWENNYVIEITNLNELNEYSENKEKNFDEFMNEVERWFDDDDDVNRKIFSMADLTINSKDNLPQKISDIWDIRPRQKKDDYFMDMAEFVASRTNCLSRRVGCVLVKDDYRVIATGYNGTPTGLDNCIYGCCDHCAKINTREGKDNCICLHAEVNALLIVGMEAQGCAKILIQAKVKKVYYKDPYGNTNDKKKIEELFDQAKIDLKPRFPQTKQFKSYPKYMWNTVNS